MAKINAEIPPLRMPLLAMRGMVLFPQMVLHFDVGREKSILALNDAMNEDRYIFLTAQRDIRDEDPSGDDIYNIGVVAEIKQIIKSQNHLRVLVEGKYRARMIKLIEHEPFFEAMVEEFPLNAKKGGSKSMTDALMRTLKDLFQEYSMMTPA